MARPKDDLSRLTINQIEVLTGATYRTIKKVLSKAGLEPEEATDNAIYFNAREALPLVFEATNSLSRPKLEFDEAGNPEYEEKYAKLLDPVIQKARKDRAHADKAEFELAVLKKKYVLATEVELAWAGILTNFRMKALGFSQANTPLLHRIKDIKEFQEKLDELMRALLEELSEHEHDDEAIGDDEEDIQELDSESETSG